MAMLRLPRVFQKLSNYSRNPSIVRTFGPTEQLQKIVDSSKCRYSALAAKNATLKERIRRLNHIVQKGGVINRQEIEIVEGLIGKGDKSIPTVSEAKEIFQCCGIAMTDAKPADRQQLLTEIVAKLDNLHIPTDISYYNALLKVYIENDHKFSASDFLSSLEKKGISPNRITYQHLMHMYCRRGDIDGAASVIQIMQSNNMPITTDICNHLILGHGYANDMESALKTIETMKEKQLEVNSETFVNLIKGYARVDDVAGIEKTFERYKEEKIELLNKDVFNAICELAENGHTNSIEPFIKHLHKTLDFSVSFRNSIDRLVRAGVEQIIPKILSTIEDDSREQLAGQCMKRMVRNQCSAERVNAIWKEFELLGFKLSTHMHIFEIGLRSDSCELIHAIINEMKAQSLPVLEKYFWKLLRLEGQKSTQNLLDLITAMRTDHNLEVSTPTLMYNVLITLNCTNNPSLTIARLETTGMPRPRALRCVVFRCLRDGNIQAALQVVSSNQRFSFKWQVFRDDLIEAVQKTNDIEHFVKFLRLQFNNEKILIERNTAPTSESSETAETSEAAEAETRISGVNDLEFFGECLNDTVKKLTSSETVLITNILNGFIKEGLSISPKYSGQIVDFLGKDITPAIRKLLDRLCSNKLKLQPLEEIANKMTSDVSLLTSKELLKLISVQEAKQLPIESLKKQLLLSYLRENNIAEAEKLIEYFEAKDSFTDSNYAVIISSYTANGNIDKALSIYDGLKSKKPDFVLDSPKIMARILEAFLDKNVEFSKIEKFVAGNRRIRPHENDTPFTDLLYNLARKGSVEQVNNISELLVQNNFLVRSSSTVGPLIRAHIVSNNIPEAIKTFETFANERKITSLRNLIYAKLIEAKDTEKLEYIFDIDVRVHGETAAMYNLAFAFAEAGLVQHTRNVLETKSLFNNTRTIEQKCKHAFEIKNDRTLETLLIATQGLQYDRRPIYLYQLLSYQRCNKVEEALDLYAQQIEEDIVPTNKFKSVLVELLKANDMEPPFELNEKEQQAPRHREKGTQEAGNKKQVSSLERYNTWKQIQLPKGRADLRNWSGLLYDLVEDNHLNEATEVAFEMFSQDKYPFRKTFKFYLSKLTQSDNLPIFDKLDEILTNDMRDAAQFNKFYIQSHINSKAGREYLKKLNTKIEGSNSEEDLQYINSTLARFGLLNLLQSQPEILDEYTKLAERWFDKKVYGPMNSLWVYHCLKSNDLSAGEKIWTKYFANAPSENVFMENFAQKIFSTENNEKLLKQLGELTNDVKDQIEAE